MPIHDGDAEPLPILTEGDPRLLRPAAPVGPLTERVRVEARRLAATLRAFQLREGFGRAIAAPQVGIGKRMIAVDLGEGPRILFDPEITWRSEETFWLWDDCMSVPGKLVYLERHASISLRFRNEQGEEERWERLPAERAELLQHELDHLDGVLMIERAGRAQDIQPASRRAELIDPQRG